MLASLEDAPLVDPHLVYEPKYDGIRAIADVGERVRLWSRLGNEKTGQFPEIAAALARWGARLKAPVVLDGEIVALDSRDEPTGFQQLQRLHQSGGQTGSGAGPAHAAFVVFDLLIHGKDDLRTRPLVDRRAALERMFASASSRVLRLSEQVRGDGRTLYRQAIERGWEGLIAKNAQSVYHSGKRTPDWRKLKITHEQEFVVAGWTEPRQSRAYFGALLLGVYERTGAREGTSRKRPGASPELIYVGHIGTGFNERELARVMKRLEPLETTECPFNKRPRTNERPHWVRPTLVAQVKFTEWTADGRLRHPVYLGLRDDKRPESVVREPESRLHTATAARLAERRQQEASPSDERASDESALLAQLDAIEESRRDGRLTLGGGVRLVVTNLQKVFWPKQKLTKGDLFRYYVRVAPCLLPAVADRPLVMKRYPDGIHGKPFYQHRAGDVPEGVRLTTVKVAASRPQLVGGDLLTLLYMTQLAAISQDPWFSRVQSPSFADYVALDLDPAPGVPFAGVLDVARWLREELELLGAIGVPKTSGSDGLHIYIRLPDRTPYEAGLLFCQLVATVVSQKHPKAATIERSVAARGRRVYIDCLQNVLGKTLATAYSARASEYAGVSTPLTWQEIDEGVRREDFTITSVPARLRTAGDLWAALRESKGIDLSRATRYAEELPRDG